MTGAAALMLVLVGCGPNERERTELRARAAVGSIRSETFRLKIDSATAAAPSEDSLLSLIRGPWLAAMLDSVWYFEEMRDEAEGKLSP